MRALRGLASCLVLISTMLLASCGGGGGADPVGNASGGSAPPPNHIATANAGGDQTVTHNATVTLDGSASADPDGDALAYHWVQTSGAPVELSSATSAKPTFKAPGQSGSLYFSLVANDGKSDSPADMVAVSVENRPPQAASVSTMAVGPGAMAVLDGSGSADPDGDPLTYTWTQTQGPTVTISTVAPGVSQFQVPNAPVTLVFALSVSDGETTSVTINVTVNVVFVVNPGPPNHAPLASAGPGMVGPRRSRVQLDGWGYDPDNNPITFSWEQTAGPPVTLSLADTPYPFFTAPDTPAQLKFVLRASDGSLTSLPSEVTVDIRNFAPVISAVSIAPGMAYTNDTLTLSAQAVDPDDDSITTRYEWRRNGTLVASQTSNTFPASLTTKNDIIKARVVVSDDLTDTSADATITILDSPAVLSAHPPTALNYGATASFTVTASDADGDATPGFDVVYGPAGFKVTNQGLVTWTAAGPLFDKVTDFNWALRVKGDEESLLSGAFKVTDSARLYPVRRTGVQIPIQYSGLRVGDFDGDGKSEMLVASSQAVYVLAKSGSTYQQTWVYPFDVSDTDSPDYDNALHAVAARDLNSDGKQEIFFSKDNQLVRLDGVTRREAARASLQCRALEIADLDRDGSLELVCLGVAPGSSTYETAGKIVVLNPSTLAEKWSSPVLPLGRGLAVGNVDHDAALEIVTAGGFVFDGQSHQNEWAASERFGDSVATGDLDGDGVDEIVGNAAAGSGVRAFSAVSKSPLWEYLIGSSGFDTLIVADANGDGKLEVIAGADQWGDVVGIGYNTTQHQPELLWQINSQNHGVTSVAVGDVDGDGVKEVVWGSGATSSGPDDFVVAGFTPSIAVKWKSGTEPQLDGGFYGGAMARIGGGASRLMFVAPRTSSGLGGMYAIALSAATGNIELSNQVGTNWGYARGFDVADYDLDNVDELLLGSADLYNGFFAAFDFGANSVEWQSPVTNNETSVAIAHADMNGDGYPDLIGITGSSYLYVYDVHAQSLIWKSTGLAGGGVDVAVADLDHDGKPEIIGALSDRIVIYAKASGGGYLERASVVTGGTTDLLVADLDGDNHIEVYSLASSYSPGSSTVTVYDEQLQLVRTVPLGVSATGLAIEDSAFARKNLVVATSRGTYSGYASTEFWAVDPDSGAEVWHSPPVPGTVSANSFQFVDMNGNGTKEIAFATGAGMFYTR